ncbi:M48 family metallopeptidase [Arthrobacter zhangbolii]|uniref:M48 family metallopeptidase n=1 Tax=Arthrobacter zhangbolii TaxID=2886936 RepID=A0A9X1M9H1_9MICC|nr:M48 family metallopeptidase [Arthrobacter zhangbolii]MCC3273978.1 M48 family metallopeptidase [Arthrobacter zhangbolii]UON91291.1 M48 family metallopeptidase [Arthrobacter zhangbolii]
MPSPSRTADASIPATTTSGIPIQVRRSARRKRTVNAVFRDGVALVSIPAHFSAAQEAEWVQRMVARLEQRVSTEPDEAASENDLMRRAAELSSRYLSGHARPASVRWVSNQNSRWGSATPGRGTIRLSDKLKGMPQWVVDYVLLHELAHLLVPSHGPAFWRLLENYPQTETAKAFLSGAAFASSRGLKGEMGED